MSSLHISIQKSEAAANSLLFTLMSSSHLSPLTADIENIHTTQDIPAVIQKVKRPVQVIPAGNVLCGGASVFARGEKEGDPGTGR